MHVCGAVGEESKREKRNSGAMDFRNGATKTRPVELQVTSSSPSKRRKVESLLLNSPGNSVSDSAATSLSSTRTTETSFSSTETVKVRSGSLDLNAEAKGLETDLSAFIISAFRETTPSSELTGEPGEDMELSKLKKETSSAVEVLKSEQKRTSMKMPSAEEIEDFFSEAEKYEEKRFAEKYNYDIVKDVPLEGRYQWVRITPRVIMDG